MRSHSGFSFLRLFSIALFFSALIIKPSYGQVEDGVVQYSGEEKVSLDGQWYFHWDELLSEKEFNQTNEPILVTVPSIWNDYLWRNQTLPSFGYATYQMEIHSDKQYEELALELSDFYSQFELFLNGESVAKNGTVGKTFAESKAEWRPQITLISLKKGVNTIILHVSNFQHSKGGFYQSLALGHRNVMLNKREQNLIVNMLLIGGMFLVGCFFLGMFFFLSWEKKVLYFSLFSIFFSLWLSHYGLHTFTLIFEKIPWTLSTRIEYLSFYLTWMFLSEFFGDLFQKDYSRWVRLILRYEVVILVLITLVTPLHIYSEFLNYFNYTGVFYLVYSLGVIIKAWIKKREGSIIVFSSFIILDIAVMITLFMFYRIIPNEPHLTNILFLLAFLILSFVFAQKFAKAFRTIEKLMSLSALQKEELQHSKVLVEKQAHKLSELNKFKSRFFANVSHDFKTPLTLILGRINQVINSGVTKLAGIDKDRLEQSRENGTYLLNLTNDLRMLVDLQNESLILQKENIDLDQYMKGIFDLFGFALEEKQIKVIFNNHIERGLVVSLDKNHFAKAISNLIANAIKFGKEKGVLKVDIAHHNEQVLIAIEDDGKGIDQDQIPFIFERYFQGRSNDYAKKEGLGIGLSISKEIIELHSGSITVKSTPGTGTTFEVRLPASLLKEKSVDFQLKHTLDNLVGSAGNESSRNDLLQENLDVPKLKKGSGKQILVVEDHPDIRSYIKEVLEEEGHQVLEAKHGVHALKILKKASVDLIITDLMMDTMDGFELIKEIKNSNELLKIPVLVISAKQSSETRLDVMAMGVNNIMPKPFNDQELKFLSKNLLEEKKQVKYTLGEAVKTALNHKEQKLEKLDEFIFQHIDQSNLILKDYSNHLNLGERTFYRLVKEYKGMTPAKYINEVKFQFAFELLRQKKVRNTSEAAHSIGYKNATDFKNIFEKVFQKTPEDVLGN